MARRWQNDSRTLTALEEHRYKSLGYSIVRHLEGASGLRLILPQQLLLFEWIPSA
jgi:hypothetical protein